ncbi:MAG: hypothetical protein LW705_10475, partial [Comamonadaceae bacterium]|nr:hypothetical protein [Comamonadaceae bacterium]
VALILTLVPCGLSVERCYLLRCPVQSGRSSSAAFRPMAQENLAPWLLCNGLRHRMSASTSGSLASFTRPLSPDPIRLCQHFVKANTR